MMEILMIFGIMVIIITIIFQFIGFLFSFGIDKSNRNEFKTNSAKEVKTTPSTGSKEHQTKSSYEQEKFKEFKQPVKPKKVLPKLTRNSGRVPGQLVVTHKIEKDNLYGDILHIAIQGEIAVPYNDYPTGIIFMITDVTNPEKSGHVLSKMDDLRDGKSNFWFCEMSRIPYQVTIYEEEIYLVRFPLSGIICPYAGDRILRLNMLAVKAEDVIKIYDNKQEIPNARVILVDFVEFHHKFEGYGFLETLELYKDSLKEVVKLLYLIAEADGQVIQSELDGIYAFLNDRVNLIEDYQKRESLRNELRREVDKYLELDEVLVLDLLEQASTHLKKNTDATYCLEAYEICLQVAVADGELSTEEKEMIEEIAFALDISKGKQKEMYDRHLRLKMAGQFSDEEFLGILPQMSLDEKKSHLTKEYNKWRGRVSNENKDIAIEANMRIEKITKLRDTLNKTG